MSAEQTHARGYGISDTSKYTEFTVKEFKLKTPGPRDVTIAIEYCGVCGSDMHTVSGGWGPLKNDWVCPGHEIVGKVIAVGPEAADEFKIGSIAGVGAQVESCLECERCKGDNENYCPEQHDTYNDTNAAGDVLQGGYSTHIRADKRFVFNIPSAIAPQDAAPILCAGITVYSPLKRNGTGPGKLVGIVGMGGLGHFAVQFAKALGAEVVLFSHSPGKASDALRLGADKFIATGDKDFAKTAGFGAANKGREFDFILSCADSNAIPLDQFLPLLKVGGRMTTVGLPDQPFSIAGFAFAGNSAAFGGSHLGSKKEMLEMLDLAAEKNIKPIIHEVLPMSRAGDAIEGVAKNTVRYRYVLKQDLV
ncbi:GroES-like protein [Filobasidium floriforme]|uniref:GroES-like protein n=1 Tax=Filobasidium floriforme TaxID=5210 RepID=UPI001E8E43E2|nr:GroES-like protein [Filobasidium floriforme]KAH8079866.1 GroES-like protein [Filobasidium floriforme]